MNTTGESPAAQRLRSLARPVLRRLFRGSAPYWEERYAKGGNSGAGSYGELSKFKAEVLNGFVRDHAVTSVIEFGCGDGHQLSLAAYPIYSGLDVAPTAINRCLERFDGDRAKSFYLYSTLHFVDHRRAFHADLALSLDVLYHLVEDEIFEAYLRHLFAAADRYVIIYASDSHVPDPAPHVRHRPFTPWVQQNIDGWRLRDKVENSISDRHAVSDFFIFERV